MSILTKRINEGLEGKFQGLANGFKDLNKYTFGVQRGTYYLIGGSSGTYKTTLLDYIVRNAMKSASDNNIECNVFYYSFEIDKLTKMCNWVSSFAYQLHGVVIPPEKIKGLGDFRLTSQEVAVIEPIITMVEEMADKIHFRFESTNPTGIFNELWKFASLHGEIQYEEYKDHEGKTKQRICGYKPNNPYAYNIVALDHLYLLKKERGFQTKEVMDKMSEYFVILRNIFGFTPIILQQFNQGLSSVDRQKFKGVDLSPSQGDFKDTTNPYQDNHTRFCRKFEDIIRPFMHEDLLYKLKSVLNKQGELLGSPTTEIVNEDNQQPSLGSNTFEGSTTNSQVLTSNVEDSNANTSALPFNIDSNGFVTSMYNNITVKWKPIKGIDY